MNLLQDKKVAIIGGGPGGLTLARLLQMQGVNVKVFERDKNRFVRQQGATLDLHTDSGLAALVAAGLQEAFIKHYRPGADKIRVINGQGTLFYDEHSNTTKPDLDFNSIYSRPEIDRGPLRDMLIASLKEQTVIWNSKFVGLEPCENGWELIFDGGNTAYADLVIAADGGNSKVRQYVTNIKPLYSGVTIVEGNIYNAEINAPKLWSLTNGGKVFVLEDGKALWLSAKGEGSLNVYTTTTESEDWVATSGINFSDNTKVKEWFFNRYKGWDMKLWEEVFQSPETVFIPRPQYHFPEDQHWQAKPNITLIGDAAHRTPPSGEGVNQAMLDALILSNALTSGSFNTVEEAIAFYEEDMFKRGTETTREALDFCALLQQKDALKKMLVFFTEPPVAM